MRAAGLQVDVGQGAYGEEHGFETTVGPGPAVVGSVGAVQSIVKDIDAVPAVMDGNASLEPVQKSWYQKPPRRQKPNGEPACRPFCKT